MLEKKLKTFIIEQATIKGEVLTPNEVNARVLALQNTRATYTVGDNEARQVATYVWDRGLHGTGEVKYGQLLKALYTDLDIQNRPAIQDKVKASNT
jgi:hypothetical protein